eukprot:1330941-Amorphochlora_amoeboformis.AAC.1
MYVLSIPLLSLPPPFPERKAPSAIAVNSRDPAEPKFRINCHEGMSPVASESSRRFVTSHHAALQWRPHVFVSSRPTATSCAFERLSLRENLLLTFSSLVPFSLSPFSALSLSLSPSVDCPYVSLFHILPLFPFSSRLRSDIHVNIYPDIWCYIRSHASRTCVPTTANRMSTAKVA